MLMFTFSVYYVLCGGVSAFDVLCGGDEFLSVQRDVDKKDGLLLGLMVHFNCIR